MALGGKNGSSLCALLLDAQSGPHGRAVGSAHSISSLPATSRMCKTRRYPACVVGLSLMLCRLSTPPRALVRCILRSPSALGYRFVLLAAVPFNVVMAHDIAQASSDMEHEAAASPNIWIIPSTDHEVDESENAAGNPSSAEGSYKSSQDPNKQSSEGNGTALAALHFNENADKGQAMTLSGELRWRVKHQKARNGEASVSSIKQAPTYGYVDRLFGVLEEYANGATPCALPAEPPHVTSTFEPVEKTSLVQSHLSRFRKQ
ncbi:hypothetical protein HPB50_012330 [Hyalomma asiaticum]|uniref:Uncharacterized protein n=1 Tax=Hyalomma asiaticum TaxID=266040 RepID=A0ACB7TJN2_HYAAI|nr:hypothetical protein HPB50_012330 [Hyalomma asiaticum]